MSNSERNWSRHPIKKKTFFNHPTYITNRFHPSLDICKNQQKWEKLSSNGYYLTRKKEIYTFSDSSSGHCLFFVPLIVHHSQDGINYFLKGLFLSEISSEKSPVLVNQTEFFPNRPFKLMDFSLNSDDLHMHFNSEDTALIPWKGWPQCVGDSNLTNVNYPSHKL